MSAMGKIQIGTSGWHYDHWSGPFYAEGLSGDRRLAFYAERFRTVEINNSFYGLPDPETIEDWRETVPDGFVFAAKASRYLTHMKKLKDPDEPLATFLDRMKGLGHKLGPILFQLPPNWHVNVERLKAFLKILPPDHRYTFEFRDETWFDERIFDALEKHNAAFCIYDLAGRTAPKEVTADFVYVRLHGPGDKYQGNYDSKTLKAWVDSFSKWAGEGRDVYCYFDNDEKGYAVRNAKSCLELVRI